jgi:hypothetical protein
MTCAEIDATPPAPGWHCGQAGHFQLIVCDASGAFQWARDLAEFPRHATPAMYALIEQAQGGMDGITDRNDGQTNRAVYRDVDVSTLDALQLGA